MAKRRKIEHIDSLALQLQANKEEFDESMNILVGEIKDLMSLKCDLIEKLRNVSRYVKKTNRAYHLLDTKASALMCRLNKTEDSLSHYKTGFFLEQQIRTQSEEQVTLMEEQIEFVENQLTQAHVDNDELRENYEMLMQRMDFVKEARVHEMSDTCNKFYQIRELLGAEKFAAEMRSVRDTMEQVRNVTVPDLADEGLCVICKSEKSVSVIIPCGHQCVCESCAKELSAKCPYCQTPFTSINKVFVV